MHQIATKKGENWAYVDEGQIILNLGVHETKDIYIHEIKEPHTELIYKLSVLGKGYGFLIKIGDNEKGIPE